MRYHHRTQNREDTERYSRWKVEKRHGKFRKTGLNNWSISKSQKGTEPGVWEDKRYLLACHPRWKWKMEITHNSVIVKLSLKDSPYLKVPDISITAPGVLKLLNNINPSKVTERDWNHPGTFLKAKHKKYRQHSFSYATPHYTRAKYHLIGVKLR